MQFSSRALAQHTCLALHFIPSTEREKNIYCFYSNKSSVIISRSKEKYSAAQVCHQTPRFSQASCWITRTVLLFPFCSCSRDALSWHLGIETSSCGPFLKEITSHIHFNQNFPRQLYSVDRKIVPMFSLCCENHFQPMRRTGGQGARSRDPTDAKQTDAQTNIISFSAPSLF